MSTKQVVRDGYVATTMVAIAQEAGVSRETVYKAFRSKPELVERVYDVALVGDEEPVPLRPARRPRDGRRPRRSSGLRP